MCCIVMNYQVFLHVCTYATVYTHCVWVGVSERGCVHVHSCLHVHVQEKDCCSHIMSYLNNFSGALKQS